MAGVTFNWFLATLLYVCLLKAYLEEGGVRKLVAVDVAFIQSEEGV